MRPFVAPIALTIELILMFSFTADATKCYVSLENKIETAKANSQPITDAICNRISEDIGVKWKDLLRSLGIKESIIEIIEEENPRSVAERCYQGLLRWKKSNGPKATVGKLAIELCEKGLKDVAASLRSEGMLSVNSRCV